jgi:hypothetical protein
MQLGTDNFRAVTCTVAVIGRCLGSNAIVSTSTVTVGLEPLLAIAVYAIGRA